MYYLQKIRNLREDKDITQKEMAEYLGILQTQYSRYERGVNELPIRYLIKIAEKLEVSIDELLKP